jgi:hypothetical protein
MSNPDRQEERPQSPRHPSGPNGALQVDQLRTFLSRLHTPHRLDTPQTRALLTHHRRLPHTLSPISVGAAAAQLLTDKIAALDPGHEAPALQRLPYEVLHTCFLQGRKNFQAAAELGLSERQLSRERGRALQLLAAELAAVSEPGVTPPPIPAVERYLRRDPLLRRLAEAVATHGLVGVTGSRRVGKTALVATLAQALGPETVWWYRIRPGVNDTLQALLIELGDLLGREGRQELRDYARAAATLDVGRATRLALDGLSDAGWLLVLDDFGRALDPDSIAAFLEEVLERLPLVSLVTIGRALPDAVRVEVPPFDQSEVAEQLVGVPQRKVVDRKSTRLNSSHK